MPVIEPAIRPPSEADSILLQVTLGCSANHCTFCGAYKGKPFKRKDPKEIDRDISRYARKYRDARRVFLMDGDALVMNNKELIAILKNLDQAFPRLTRVSSYANGYNIARRSDTELKELYDNKMRLIYMGLESGSQEILDRCKKASGADEMVEAVNRVSQAGIKASVIVLLGLGGKKNSEEHVKCTIEALNRMQPRYLSFLSLMAIPGTPLWEEVEDGSFEELDPLELLKESRDIIKGLELKKTIFRSNHASNYLPLEGSLPKDKERLLRDHNSAINGEVDLKPDFLRGL